MLPLIIGDGNAYHLEGLLGFLRQLIDIRTNKANSSTIRGIFKIVDKLELKSILRNKLENANT